MAAPGRRRRGQKVEVEMRVGIGYDFLALHVGRRMGTRESGVVVEGSLFGQIRCRGHQQMIDERASGWRLSAPRGEGGNLENWI
jgi:hypothetical protein